MPEENNAIILPEFKCHKVVQAALITGIIVVPEDASLEDTEAYDLTLEGLDGVMRVPVEWVHSKCDAVEGGDIDFGHLVGGMLVIYEDGYQSWSPKDVFDAGYRSVAEIEAEKAKEAKKGATVRGKNLVAKLDKLIDKLPEGQCKTAMREARRIAEIEKR